MASAANYNNLWTIIAVIFEYYCINWQRNDVFKGIFSFLITYFEGKQTGQKPYAYILIINAILMT